MMNKKRVYFMALLLAVALLCGCELIAVPDAAETSAPPPTPSPFNSAPMVTHTPTPTPKPTPTPVPLISDETLEALSGLIEACEYAGVFDVVRDEGGINVASGLSPLSEDTTMLERQYTLSCFYVLKGGDRLIEGGEILLSIPRIYGPTDDDDDLMPQPGYLALEEGERYLILLNYIDSFEFFSPAGGMDIYTLELGQAAHVPGYGEE